MEDQVLQIQKWWRKLPKCNDCGTKWSFVSTELGICDFCNHNNHSVYDCDACQYDEQHYWDNEEMYKKLYLLRKRIQ